MVDRAPVESSTKHAESLSIGNVKHRGLVACVPWAGGEYDEDAALKLYNNGQVELWNGHCALLKYADSWVVWTHLHKREAFCGSKSHRHSRKPSNIHHCQAPSQVLKMTCETNNGQESNIWMSKASPSLQEDGSHDCNQTWNQNLLFSTFFGRSLLFLIQTKRWPTNLKADILEPLTGIARPLIGVSIAGQAPARWISI